MKVKNEDIKAGDLVMIVHEEKVKGNGVRREEKKYKVLQITGYTVTMAAVVRKGEIVEVRLSFGSTLVRKVKDEVQNWNRTSMTLNDFKRGFLKKIS